MREHWNDVPGDIAGEEADDLPGGFGVDDPDKDVDANYTELFGQKSYRGEDRITTAAQGGDTLSAEIESVNTGATVDYPDLLAGEESVSGAAVGFIGDEEAKQYSPEELAEHQAEGPPPLGGEETETETEQQQRDRSTESGG